MQTVSSAVMGKVKQVQDLMGGLEKQKQGLLGDLMQQKQSALTALLQQKQGLLGGLLPAAPSPPKPNGAHMPMHHRPPPARPAPAAPAAPCKGTSTMDEPLEGAASFLAVEVPMNGSLQPLQTL